MFRAVEICKFQREKSKRLTKIAKNVTLIIDTRWYSVSMLVKFGLNPFIFLAMFLLCIYCTSLGNHKYFGNFLTM